MSEKKLRSTRMSKVQKEHLVRFLENNKILLLSKLQPREIALFNDRWKTLAQELNNLEGAKKNVSQWKDAFNDFKANCRKKSRLLHFEATGTGGGPKKEKDLTPIEERMLSLLSKIVITGLPGVPEAGISDSTNTVKKAIENMTENDEPYQETIEFYVETQPPIEEIIITETEATTPTKAAISTPTVIRKRKPNIDKDKKIDKIAQDHEKCLKVLAESNNNLAQATYALCKITRKKLKVGYFHYHFNVLSNF